MDLNEEILKALLEKVDIESMVQGVVEDEVRSMVSREARDQLRGLITKKIDTIIEAEVVRIVTATPVAFNTGWGEKTIYPTFDDFFKANMKKKIEATYEIRSLVEKGVKTLVDQFMADKLKDATGKIIEELLKKETK